MRNDHDITQHELQHFEDVNHDSKHYESLVFLNSEPFHTSMCSLISEINLVLSRPGATSLSYSSSQTIDFRL